MKISLILTRTQTTIKTYADDHVKKTSHLVAKIARSSNIFNGAHLQRQKPICRGPSSDVIFFLFKDFSRSLLKLRDVILPDLAINSIAEFMNKKQLLNYVANKKNTKKSIVTIQLFRNCAKRSKIQINNSFQEN